MTLKYDLGIWHDAIIAVHPEVKFIKGDNAFEDLAMTKQVTIDHDKVVAKKAELEKFDYQWKRSREYPNWNEQLEYIYDNGIDKWKSDMVDPIKTKYPKPTE